MEYKYLTVEQRQQMLTGRIQQFEVEHYQHEMNKAAVSSLPDSDEKAAAIEQADAAQATLEGAINAAETELAALEK